MRLLRAEIETIRRFPREFTDLWKRVAPKFDLAVRRDAQYLNWKYIEAPHVRYAVAALKREGRFEEYAVYRHLQEPHGRVTSLVDFLVDPEDHAGMKTLLRWIHRAARLISTGGTYSLHMGYRKWLRNAGYFTVKSSMEFTLKINDVPVPDQFYQQTDRWHVTLG